jgi:hypothetical protein
MVLRLINEWFKLNMLSLNFNITSCMQFTTITNFTNKLNTEYENTWKTHTVSIIGKLSKACYIIRKSKQYLCIDALKMVYYAFLRSVISYGLIFWGNRTHSMGALKLHRRAIQIMVGDGNRDSCK